jgi:protein tyrosine phosphatase (PTP) superfamily phosphohydrolase (DUF442 family)
MQNILNYICRNDMLSTAGQPSNEEFKKIAKEGYEVVINLALCKSDNALKNEDKIVTEYKMSYVHIPVSWEEPEEEKLEEFFMILEALKEKKVFLHCAKNYRASMFFYLYEKCVLKKQDAKLVLPEGYEPNETWKRFMAKYTKKNKE